MNNNRHLLPEEVKIPPAEVFAFDEAVHAASIAAVSGLSTLVKNTVIEPSLLLSLLFKKEAETSSKIEGTNVTFEEVAFEGGDHEIHTQKKQSDVREALGVADAITVGTLALEKNNFPVSNRVIKMMHKALMEKAASDQGTPGEFRKGKVRIGARYFPPEPQHVSNLMSDLEKYIHRDVNISPMVKIAVIHAQFEIIHPFSDGNGRIGRLLVPFLMKEYGLTNNISCFISQYFEQHRNEYYNNLENITKRKDWDAWVNFFLQSVAEHGNEIRSKVENLIRLYTDGEFLALKNIDSQHIKNYIFKNPIFTVPSMIQNLEKDGITVSNKNDLHRILTGSPNIVVTDQGRGRRQTRYACPKIITIINTFQGD